MSTDLSKTSSEVVETNSLREILLFCAVLLVEIYSLAVSFGGPFFEVGYFLLVVISQTFAGAYIWAQLRQSEKTLPLPELLAMGFAIGSASAAISQLIIRDLLGIRLFISPLVPIIGVAIWLITKRDPQLPVKVTHTTTNSLLWLLFPAPLAYSHWIPELMALFILPLLIYATKRKHQKSIITVLILTSSTSVFWFRHIFTTLPFSLTSINHDQIYDYAHSLGISSWGISDNINVVGETFSYYKFTYLWLGPIVNLIPTRSIFLATTIIPIVFYVVIGLVLWALTLHISKIQLAANISAVLLFLQASLPEPWVFERRPLYLYSVFILVSVLLIFSKTWENEKFVPLTIAVTTFVLTSTRIQYSIVFFLAIALKQLFSLTFRKEKPRDIMTVALAILFGLIASFLTFFSRGDPQSSYISFQDKSEALKTLFLGVAVRAIVPTVICIVIFYRKLNFTIPLTVTSASLVIYFLTPRFESDFSAIEVILIATVPVVAILLAHVFTHLGDFRNRIFYVCVALIGIFARFAFDFFKWMPKNSYLGAKKVIHYFFTSSSSEIAFNLLFFTLLSLFSWFALRPGTDRRSKFLVIASIACFFSFGVSIATNLRMVTNSYRYNEDLFSKQVEGPDFRWLVDVKFIEATKYLKDNTAQDDIFATNVHRYDDDYQAYGSSLIVSSIIERRSYVEAPFYDRRGDRESTPPEFKIRLRTSMDFPNYPSRDLLANMRKEDVKWFVVDLTNTTLRDWEPWATTRFMNEKVAILELAQVPVPSN